MHILATCFVSYTHTFVTVDPPSDSDTRRLLYQAFVSHLTAYLVNLTCETEELVIHLRRAYSEKGKMLRVTTRVSAPRGKGNNNIVYRVTEGPGYMER